MTISFHKNAFLFLLLAASCTPFRPAMNFSKTEPVRDLKVKGRQGFLINQKLSFGPYSTGKVKRSWTSGYEFDWAKTLPSPWAEVLSIRDVDRKQRLRFQLKDSLGNTSDVMCFSKVSWTDFSVGNPNSIVNIVGDFIPGIDRGDNTYSVQILTSSKEKWDLLLDNNASQVRAKNYVGFLARDKDHYFKVVPITRLLDKKGKPADLLFGGSVGFEFQNAEGRTLAGVSLIDKGMVYFGNATPEERFVLANAAAALLLQQDIESQ
jgi:hypothetical protein